MIIFVRSARDVVGRISDPVAVTIHSGVTRPAVPHISSTVSVKDLCRRIPGIGSVGPSDIEIVQVDGVAFRGI